MQQIRFPERECTHALRSPVSVPGTALPRKVPASSSVRTKKGENGYLMPSSWTTMTFEDVLQAREPSGKLSSSHIQDTWPTSPGFVLLRNRQRGSSRVRSSSSRSGCNYVTFLPLRQGRQGPPGHESAIPGYGLHQGPRFASERQSLPL